MLLRRTLLCLGCLLVTTVLPAAQDAAPSESPREQETLISTASPKEVAASAPVINGGCVVWDGLYVPPPYRVFLDEGVMHLDNRALPPVQLTMRGSPRMFGRKAVPSAHGDRSNQLGVIQRSLQHGGMLLIQNDKAVMLRPDLKSLVLQTLFADEEPATKAKRLGAMVSGSSTIDIDWNSVVASFAYEPELSELYLPQPAVSDEAALEIAGVGERSLRYGMTVTGMLLGVFGFGMLLQHQPHVRRAEGANGSRGPGFDLLPMYALLVFVFSVFDLACTLFAQETGGLLELNPLGNAVIENPLLVSVAKVSITLGSVLILLKLREYRFAQVASWWLCLVCVLLTLRWVSFNSMFMA